jgi:hypothetical protein
VFLNSISGFGLGFLHVNEARKSKSRCSMDTREIDTTATFILPTAASSIFRTLEENHMDSSPDNTNLSPSPNSNLNPTLNSNPTSPDNTCISTVSSRRRPSERLAILRADNAKLNRLESDFDKDHSMLNLIESATLNPKANPNPNSDPNADPEPTLQTVSALEKGWLEVKDAGAKGRGKF